MNAATTFTLDNGMRFIVAEDHTAPVVALALRVEAGVCDEPPDRRGTAHFLEHMMFRGSAHFAHKEHGARIARVGGRCNAFTGDDQIVYHECVPASFLEQALELEADRFQRLRLTAEHVDVERKVVLEERQAGENQPYSSALRLLKQKVAGAHPYALGAIGRRQDLEAVSVEDLARFHAQTHSPERVFAVICGDLTAESVRPLADRYFGSRPATVAAPTRRPAMPFSLATGRMSERLSEGTARGLALYFVQKVGTLCRP